MAHFGDRIVKKPILWMVRCMALGHYAWGTAILLLAAWLAISALRILSYMRSAAQGGGLLSSIGMFPLAIGAGVVVLALTPIVLALSVVPNLRHLN